MQPASPSESAENIRFIGFVLLVDGRRHHRPPAKAPCILPSDGPSDPRPMVEDPIGAPSGAPNARPMHQLWRKASFILVNAPSDGPGHGRGNAKHNAPVFCVAALLLLPIRARLCSVAQQNYREDES